ncbi:MAG TPA: hypothetical protein VN969_11970 [Streptosporangiaceae bacterium]|jgi:hypothetical protein|nr:hypothetical protein [Streptosporangiaceae bacterium]
MEESLIWLAAGAIGAALIFLAFLLEFRRASTRDPLSTVAPNWSARRARRVVGVYVRRDDTDALTSANTTEKASSMRE